MSEWTPSEQTTWLVEEFVTTLLYRLPYLIGIDELINDCEVVNLDPEGVGVDAFPRYITVTLKRYHQMVVYRGFPELSVGDIVTVAHFRQGDLYEIIGIGGAAGEVTFPLSRLGGYCRGCIIRGGATEWESHFAGGDGYAITGDGTDVFSLQDPIWSGQHTWSRGPQTIITGGAANVGLILRADAAQGVNIFEVQDSGSVAITVIDSGGNLDVGVHAAIGGGAAVLTTSVLHVDEDDVATTGSLQCAIQAALHATPIGSSSASYHGVHAQAIQDSTDTLTSSTALRGVWGGSVLSGTGLVTGAFGVQASNNADVAGASATTQVAVDAGAYISTGASATVSTQVMLRATAPTGPGTWTITNLYGLYVENMSVGTGNNYAVYTNDGENRFGDHVRILRAYLPQLTLEMPAFGATTTFETTISGDLLVSPSGNYMQLDEDFRLDSGIGDSPRLTFITGTFNDTVHIFLEEGLYADHADLIVDLPDYAGESKFVIRESGLYGADVAWIDSAGNMFLQGEAVSISPSYASYNSDATLSVVQNTVIGGRSSVLYLRQRDNSEYFMHFHSTSTGGKTSPIAFNVLDKYCVAYLSVYVEDDRAGGLTDGRYWIELQSESS